MGSLAKRSLPRNSWVADCVSARQAGAMELAAASVTRSIELPVSAEEAWTSLRDADGLAGWLGDAVDLPDVAPGAAGRIVEGDAVRRLVVTEVLEGRSIGFVWWDEAAPEDASVVTIAVEPGDGETSTVSVTERLAGGVVASMGEASIADLGSGAGGAWDRRLRQLVGEAALADAFVGRSRARPTGVPRRSSTRWGTRRAASCSPPSAARAR
jgi:uncharacterized protein YndB with AHSA1/START domain